MTAVKPGGFLFLSKRIEELGYCCPKILIHANWDPRFFALVSSS